MRHKIELLMVRRTLLGSWVGFDEKYTADIVEYTMRTWLTARTGIPCTHLPCSMLAETAEDHAKLKRPEP